MTVYAIDGTPPSTRTDIEHTPVPGEPQSRREDQFPDIAERIVFSGPLMPPDFQIVSWIEATAATGPQAIAALLNAELAFAAFRGDDSVHTITLYDNTYADCELVAFNPVGPMVTIATDSDVKVGRRWRWAWRQLSR